MFLVVGLVVKDQQPKHKYVIYYIVNKLDQIPPAHPFYFYGHEWTLPRC